jgi:hypothetical protein
MDHVEVAKRDIELAPNGAPVLLVTLSRMPPAEWASAFTDAKPPGRAGSPAFLNGSPKLHGTEIRFVVEEDDIGPAAHWVDACIAQANEVYEAMLAAKRDAADAIVAEAAVFEQRRQDLKKRLDEAY